MEVEAGECGGWIECVREPLTELDEPLRKEIFPHKSPIYEKMVSISTASVVGSTCKNAETNHLEYTRFLKRT